MKEDPNVESITGPTTGEKFEKDPKIDKQIQSFTSVIMELLHSPKSRDSVTDVLMSNEDPFVTVPMVVLQTNDMAVNLMKQKGVEVPFNIQLAASAALLEDVIHLGYAAVKWEELTEEDIAALYEDVLQAAIERGLSDGSIDPIQLQLEVEPLMDEDQKRAGTRFKEDAELGDEPSQGAMVNQHVGSKMRKQEALNAQRQNKDKAALQGQMKPQQGGM